MPAPVQSRVNLLPTDRFEFSKIGRFLGWALTTGRYLVVLTELVVTIAFLSRFWFDRTLTDLRESRVQKEAIVDSFNEVLTRFLKVQSKFTTIQAAVGKPTLLASNRLLEVQSVTPSGVQYNQIHITKEKATIKGFTQTPDAFSVLLTNLQASSSFSDVSVRVLRLSEDRQSGFDFEVEMKPALLPSP